MAPVETSQASQPTTLSAPQRHDGLCSDETTGPDRLVTRRGATCACSRRESLREPDAGNLHVRFDEGRGASSATSPTLPPHEHAQHPCHRVPPVACPGLLKVADIKGPPRRIGATPGSTTSPNACCHAL